MFTLIYLLRSCLLPHPLNYFYFFIYSFLAKHASACKAAQVIKEGWQSRVSKIMTASKTASQSAGTTIWSKQKYARSEKGKQ
jgi:hypothetical protein